MNLYARNTNYLASNGGDYYREWRADGSPVAFNTVTRGFFSEVVFGHWFAEVKGAGKAPVLLSHWVPDSLFASGTTYEATKTRDQTDWGLSKALDDPWGYKNFVAVGAAGFVGDDRPIDGMGEELRFQYFTNITSNLAYNTSEGYMRESVSVVHELFPERIIVLSRYLQPAAGAGGPYIDTDLRVHQYRVAPDGQRVSSFVFNDVNFERVYFSTDFGGHNIDLLYSPLFRFAMGRSDDGWSNLPPGY